MLLSDLEVRLEQARAELEAAREILNDARLALDKVEGRARDTWLKKKAALHSRAVTLACAAACGLKASPSTLAAAARFQARADAATAEIRAIIDSSRHVCDLFESAWNSYAVARSKEIDTLQLISDLSVEIALPINSVKVHKLMQDLIVAQESKAKENVQRRRELSLPDESHYDPQYDERELLERRMRPWV